MSILNYLFLLSKWIIKVYSSIILYGCYESSNFLSKYLENGRHRIKVIFLLHNVDIFSLLRLLIDFGYEFSDMEIINNGCIWYFVKPNILLQININILHLNSSCCIVINSFTICCLIYKNLVELFNRNHNILRYSHRHFFHILKILSINNSFIYPLRQNKSP